MRDSNTVVRKMWPGWLFCVLSVTCFSQAFGVYTDGQTINMVLSPDAYNGTLFLRGIIAENATIQVVVERAALKPTDFVIFQAHSYVLPVALSVPGQFTFGTDVGLYSQLNKEQLTFFIYNSNSAPVDMIILPVAYENDKPIPGGCNLSFDVAIAPYMQFSLNGNDTVFVMQVDAQPASFASQGYICGPSSSEYEIFEFNIQDTSADGYFHGILSVATASAAAKNGRLTRKPISGPLLRRRLAAYYGFGKILVASVRDSSTGASSAYVPIAWYYSIRGNNTFSATDAYRFPALMTIGIWLSTYPIVGVFSTCVQSLQDITRFFFAISVFSVWMLLLPLEIDTYIGIAVGLFLYFRIFRQSCSFLFFPLCIAQLAFGVGIWCGLATVEGYDSPLVLWSTFGCLYALVVMIDLVSSTFVIGLLDWFVVTYAFMAVISEVTFGSLVYVLADPARLLKPGESDVIFSNSDTTGNALLATWLALATVLAVGLTCMLKNCTIVPRKGYDSLED